MDDGRCWCGSPLKGLPHNCIGTRGRVEELLGEISKLTLQVNENAADVMRLQGELSEEKLQNQKLQKRVETLENDKETLREACETVYYQITNHGNMSDSDLAALVSNAMNEVVERRDS